MPALTEAGIKVIPVIPSVKLAKKMEDLGAVAVVAEGIILGTKYPLIQGSMARISRHELVIAVSNAGGLGVLTSAGFDKEGLREEIRKVKAGTDKPFAVNLMLILKLHQEWTWIRTSWRTWTSSHLSVTT
ncbi:nitronate monooxygenase [Weissella confusa]|uniref:Nitronate monooxygenase n=1 Tax=Weissella confusa TaxID=1583 RepID=A0A923NHP4_WEICO|nr:nitronate monooxygenase [Weissella confusa]